MCVACEMYTIVKVIIYWQAMSKLSGKFRHDRESWCILIVYHVLSWKQIARRAGPRGVGLDITEQIVKINDHVFRKC